MTAICRVSLAEKKNSLPPLEEGNRERRRDSSKAASARSRALVNKPGNRILRESETRAGIRALSCYLVYTRRKDRVEEEKARCERERRRKKGEEREREREYGLVRSIQGERRGPLGWLPHERCIRRLTGGAIKSRQQTDRQSPLCTSLIPPMQYTTTLRGGIYRDAASTYRRGVAPTIN